MFSLEGRPRAAFFACRLPAAAELKMSRLAHRHEGLAKRETAEKTLDAGFLSAGRGEARPEVEIPVCQVPPHWYLGGKILILRWLQDKRRPKILMALILFAKS